MATLIICRGIPASGKTTWAKAWVEAQPIVDAEVTKPKRARMNRDDFRHMMFGVYWGLTRDEENAVTVAQHTSIEKLLRKGWDVVCDDTNLRAKTFKTLAAVAARSGADVRVEDFDIPVQDAIDRDDIRLSRGERAVGDKVIRQFWEKFGRNGLPPVPELEPEQTAATYTPHGAQKAAWLVDLDGTLAKMDDRGPFEWHRVGEDLLNEPVQDVVLGLARIGFNIVAVSGRDGSCRGETEKWLDRHGVPHEALFMRPAGDTRKDTIVKAEIFWNDIAPYWDVFGVLDDRDQVVEMWRSLGLTCLQVAPGDF